MEAFTNLILLLQPKQFDYESNLDNPSSDSIQCIHDIRMVWSTVASGNEDLIKLAAYTCNPVFVGSCLSGVLRTGAGKPHRLHRERRPVQSDAA